MPKRNQTAPITENVELFIGEAFEVNDWKKFGAIKDGINQHMLAAEAGLCALESLCEYDGMIDISDSRLLGEDVFTLDIDASFKLKATGKDIGPIIIPSMIWVFDQSTKLELLEDVDYTGSHIPTQSPLRATAAFDRDGTDDPESIDASVIAQLSPLFDQEHKTYEVIVDGKNLLTTMQSANQGVWRGLPAKATATTFR